MFINFITNLFDLKEYNVICIIVHKLFLERYYELCTAIDENISIKTVAKILIQRIFTYYYLFIFITLNREFQFIATV